MAITSMLFYSAARTEWQWSALKAGILTGIFLLVDAAFLMANTLKIVHGGWVPLVVGGGIMALMTIWMWGRARLYARISREALPV
ncbi:MAG: hypothetical protein RLY69_425, partial [Verrucomicrobiota bacterium]